MSRRRRALAFLAGALVCAGLAATLAGGYERSVAEQLGELRSVVVAKARLPAKRPIAPRQARADLEVRRIPAKFAPPDALATPEEAVGLEPTAALTPGSYLLAGQLSAPRSRGSEAPRPAQGMSPIELEVTGAGALVAAGRSGYARRRRRHLRARARRPRPHLRRRRGRRAPRPHRGRRRRPRGRPAGRRGRSAALRRDAGGEPRGRAEADPGGELRPADPADPVAVKPKGVRPL